ncbi:swr1 complex component [Ascosphaera pollenicola]|nr:swr1 complex component [Ascosphaera pollenicola]
MQNGSKSQHDAHNDSTASTLNETPTKTPANNTTTPCDSTLPPPPLPAQSGPPSKRRKTDRPPSPPWKSAAHEGPTSLFIDGRRKSSRTNRLLGSPSASSPVPSAALAASSPDPQSTTKGRLSSARSNPAGATSLKSRIANAFSQSRLSTESSIQLPPPPSSSKGRSRSSSTRNNIPRTPRNAATAGIDLDATPTSASAVGSVRKLPRIRLKVAKPSLAAYHPANVLPAKKFPSFRDWFNAEGALDPAHRSLSEEDALQEARIRRRLLDAAEPGNLLSEDRCSLYLTDPLEEPPRQYFHRDHFIAHTLYFKKLLDKEHKQHRNVAKLLAQACAEEWRRRHKRPEDLLRQQHDLQRQKWKQLVKDLQRMFDSVRAEVDKLRLARWEAEKKIEDQMALNKAIKQSTMLFEKRRSDRRTRKSQDGEDTPDRETEAEGSEGEDEDEEDEEGSDDSESERSDFMSSTSESGSDVDETILRDEDEDLTAEQLREKYAHLTPAGPFKKEFEPASDSDKIVPGFAESSTAHGKENFRQSTQPPTKLDGGDNSSYHGPPPQLEEVDPVLLDDSEEESTDMDEEDESESDEDEDDHSEEEADEDDDDEADSVGLLGFFSGHDLEEMKRKAESTEEMTTLPTDQGADNDTIDPEPTPMQRDYFVTDDEIGDDDEVELVPAGSGLQSTRTATPATSEQGAEATLDYHQDHIPPATTDIELAQNHAMSHPSVVVTSTSPGQDTNITSSSPPQKQLSPVVSPVKALDKLSEEPEEYADIKTPIPELLRGTLRKYQHYGLDWLAGLYNNNINGILADEMGLGKTIQTIALLAHLAIEHEVWGPHLVVVPTSVMLNWEMEFKKWAPGFKILTYYGSQEERRQKRRGWMDDDRWHVCITSYQLVLQDQQTFKRRNWHYMILDEAHNIKNFRSQRWQTLLTFKTHSRLLLTGTPLQNNLTELWSLLFFLMPSDDNDMGIEGFADLRNFSEWFRRPVEQILEHGRETMDEEAKQVVTKLHTVLRPYILRRLKIDVEKQMPAKYEHVVVCKLSKRQRYLYDGFMSRAQTKETLASGNYLSIINCLMQLRKVCNHPDLFETRPITTSFAMPRTVIADFEISELLVRRRLLTEHPERKLNLDFMNLVPISDERLSKIFAKDIASITAHGALSMLREKQYKSTNWEMKFDGSSALTALNSVENNLRKSRLEELEQCIYLQSQRHARQPLWGQGLLDMLTISTTPKSLSARPRHNTELLDWYSDMSPTVASMFVSLEDRARQLKPIIEKYAFVTPSVVAPGVTDAALTPIETRMLSPSMVYPPYDPLHEPQTRLTIAFPDKRLLQYDCGKLQQLESLLRKLQAGGHRALIFTQMTKMLDILEQFLNIHGYLYLRLDGATKVEQRQILTDRFNSDPRILVFILSSRSGGLGINLTGADTVIFYDLDWNPAMDKQCQDRCHRIGQTRDVHIYRLVSEYTIESNILRKANQKRMLDDVVIQEGQFTTDYFQRPDVRKMLGDLGGQDEASAAMDRVLDAKVGAARTFEQAEDKEDIYAAKNAEKEVEKADAGDFEENSGVNIPGHTQTTSNSRIGTPGPPTSAAPDPSSTAAQSHLPVTSEADETVNGVKSTYDGHIDAYLLRFMEWNLKDAPLVLPPDKRKRSRRGHEHRIRRHR